MLPPKAIRIGPHVYTFENLTEDGLLGRTQHTKQVIQIKSDQGVTSKRDTVLHEVIHAICDIAGMGYLIGVDDEGEERIIRLLTPWLLGLLRDNPRLVAYLLEK